MGFFTKTKGVAIIRQVTQLTPRSVCADEALATGPEAMKVKEDLRTVLKTWVTLGRSEYRAQEAQTAQLKIDALGPSR